ncbi:MAG: tRNA (N(6)-L-threonylcarbamoyladenosine(37)-C(2))-methylthiotransferase MtaB [Alphaproteobacteria bacterium]|nr:tRNA (N(6)-L-threonylcarbamoyladenosine(37)-C(2))-methylthiotransferase MtaB [Alphaproteobacteria bacterium]
MSVQVLSLGCRLNLSEAEEMRAMLAAADDLVVVNSCAVTSEAVRQTRQAIRRARRANPDARLLVTGCAAEVEREALAAMPEVDGIVANRTKLDPRSWNTPRSFVRPVTRHTRAFVQVQNGCDHACTFCVIPQGRGASRSLSVADVLREAERHVERGVQEVVLTGVDLTSWGTDLPGAPRLGALCEAILAAFPALPRLRLSSIDGAEVDDALIALFAHERRMMPHLHLSLQSGNDLILKRMKRRHSRADAVRLVNGLRAHRPDLALGADLIAGFPTEDEAMHANNLSIVAELGVVHGHVFPFSPRPGTPAARMPQVDPVAVKARAAELRKVVARERSRWLGSMLGKPLAVLAEKDGTGHAENFAPVVLPGVCAAGEIVTITPRAIANGMLA